MELVTLSFHFWMPFLTSFFMPVISRRMQFPLLRFVSQHFSLQNLKGFIHEYQRIQIHLVFLYSLAFCYRLFSWLVTNLPLCGNADKANNSDVYLFSFLKDKVRLNSVCSAMIFLPRVPVLVYYSLFLGLAVKGLIMKFPCSFLKISAAIFIPFSLFVHVFEHL